MAANRGKESYKESLRDSKTVVLNSSLGEGRGFTVGTGGNDWE